MKGFWVHVDRKVEGFADELHIGEKRSLSDCVNPRHLVTSGPTFSGKTCSPGALTGTGADALWLRFPPDG